ncbi:MAG: glycosyltransferase family 2 protein [Alphaproteobacteria bacterium]
MFTWTTDIVTPSERIGLPVVSVVIPTHNRWPLLGEAIESVLTQSYRRFELIVIDDGSTDDTDRKLAEFGSRLRLIRQPRRGVSAARNRGATAARGRYLAFLDSDDLWLVEKLKVQTGFMEEYPGIQICQTDEIWMRHGLRVNPKVKHQKPSGDIFRRSLELCLVSPSAVMMTRALFNGVGGFDERLPVCEDYDLWLRIAADYSVPLIPYALTVKRGGHGDQLSHSVWGMDRYRVAALQKLLRTNLSGEKRQWAIETLRRKISILAHGARKRGKDEEVLAYETVLREFIEESVDVRGADSRLCGGKELSPADG